MKKSIVIFLSGLICWMVSPFVVAQDTGADAPALVEPIPAQTPAPVPQIARGTYPISEVDRPLALPRLMLRPEADLGMVFLRNNDTVTYFGIDLAASMGVMDHLEVGFGHCNTPMSETQINRFPLSYTPDAQAGNLPLYGLYEWGNFFKGKIRAAGRLTINIPIDRDFWLLADMPAKFKLHDIIAIVADIGMGFMIGENTSAFLFNVDFGPLVAPSEAVAMRLTVGFHVHARDNGTTLIPLMLRTQYTILGDIDAFVDLGFPDVNNAGGDWFQLIFGACYRYQF